MPDVEQVEREMALGRIGEEFRKLQQKVVPLRRPEPAEPEGSSLEPDPSEPRYRDPGFKPPKRIPDETWRTRPPETKWLVNGLLSPGIVTLLSGRPGAGKGLLAMTCATGILAGLPFIGRATAGGGPVMGLFYEDSRHDLTERQWRIDEFYGLGHGDFANLRTYYSMVDREDSWLAEFDQRSWALRWTDHWTWLVEETERLRPTLLIVDGASTALAANPNDPVLVRKFVSKFNWLAQVSGAAIWLTVHPSRTAVGNPFASDGVGYSVQWVAAVRLAAFLDICDESDKDRRSFEITKSNNAPKFSVPLRWNGSLLVPDIPGMLGGGAGSADKELFLELFDRAWSRKMWVSHSSTAREWWAPKALPRIGGLDTEDKTLRKRLERAMTALMAEGTLVMGTYKGTGYHLRGRLERVATTDPTTHTTTE
jgi:hypothetical protein